MNKEKPGLFTKPKQEKKPEQIATGKEVARIMGFTGGGSNPFNTKPIVASVAVDQKAPPSLFGGSKKTDDTAKPDSIFGGATKNVFT